MNQHSFKSLMSNVRCLKIKKCKIQISEFISNYKVLQILKLTYLMKFTADCFYSPTVHKLNECMSVTRYTNIDIYSFLKLLAFCSSFVYLCH